MSALGVLRIRFWLAFFSACAPLVTGGIAHAGTAATSQTPAPATPQRIEFWTIEANEGQSAGGHSALRIDEVVYHVEHRGDGLIIDRRDPVEAFERVYRQMGNRSIEVLDLDLPAPVAQALESRLRQRYFDRKRRLNDLADLEEDLAWLTRTIERGRLEIYVPGLGLIDETSGGCLDARPSAGRRSRIIQGKAPGWVSNRVSRARRELHRVVSAATEYRPASPSLPQSASRSADRSIPHTASGTRDVVEAAQRLAALEAIFACRSPRSELIVALDPDSAQHAFSAAGYSIAEQERWKSIESELEANLRRLLESDRPDAGLAILLAWSRLAAIDATRQSQTIHLLDPISEATRRPRNGASPIPEGWHNARIDNAHANLMSTFDRLEAGTPFPVEARLFDLETAHHSLSHALAGDLHDHAASESELRVTRATRFRGATFDLPWPKELTIEQLERRRKDVKERVERRRNELETDLGYALFTRNCVTELFSALDEALSTNPQTASHAQGRAKDIEASLGFIPVVAGRIASRHLPISGRRHLASWRMTAIESKGANRIAGLASRLRESNTLSSNSYHPNARDSIFLFFSQDPVWARPLTGVANLLTGIGATTLGVLSAPFDQGELARRGLQGVVMSVPELFFFNIRKGSFIVPPPSLGNESRPPTREPSAESVALAL